MPAPYRVAEPLGPLVSSHPVAGAQQTIRIGVGIFCLLVTVDVLALPFFDLPGTRDFDWHVLIPLGAIALVFLWLAVSSFRLYLRARRQRAEVHEEGLLLHDGARTSEVRWSDVVSVGGLVWETPGQAPVEGAALWIDVRGGERLPLPSPVREPYALGREIRGR
ncbi:MAG TPA: hypothetical protein VLS89_15155, partial [Candidatus Nanopelagicales bacterium]|nr:hypothetical protein [Candidatus Nanopelagicales bacterium]